MSENAVLAVCFFGFCSVVAVCMVVLTLVREKRERDD